MHRIQGQGHNEDLRLLSDLSPKTCALDVNTHYATTYELLLNRVHFKQQLQYVLQLPSKAI